MGPKQKSQTHTNKLKNSLLLAGMPKSINKSKISNRHTIHRQETEDWLTDTQIKNKRKLGQIYINTMRTNYC